MKNVNLLISTSVFHFSVAFNKAQAKPTEVVVLPRDESNDSSTTPPLETRPPQQTMTARQHASHARREKKTKGCKSFTLYCSLVSEPAIVE